MAIFAIAGLLLWNASTRPGRTAATTSTTVAEASCVTPPNLWQHSLAWGRRRAHDAGFTLRIVRVTSTAPAGWVVNQDDVQGCDSDTHPAPLVEVSSGPLGNPWATLPMASLPPAAPECTVTVAFDVDGNLGPATCESGEVNAAAWVLVARWFGNDGFGPFVRLGSRATPAEIIRIFRHGVPSGPIGVTEYELASAYYQWPHWKGYPECVVIGNCPREG